MSEKAYLRTNLADHNCCNYIPVSLFLTILQSTVVERFRNFESIKSAATAHRQFISSFKSHWMTLRSTDTCFGCLQRRPQFRLICGHSVCENCVKVFGTKDTAEDCLYHMEKCIFCESKMQDLRIRVKQDTARIRVLSIDGGGIRGIAPLEFLKAIQHRVKLPEYPVQRHFDIIFGTSSGKNYTFKT